MIWSDIVFETLEEAPLSYSELRGESYRIDECNIDLSKTSGYKWVSRWQPNVYEYLIVDADNLCINTGTYFMNKICDISEICQCVFVSYSFDKDNNTMDETEWSSHSSLGDIETGTYHPCNVRMFEELAKDIPTYQPSVRVAAA